ncbi:diacylglycerol kinase family protein [Daejeonella lutea]|uniref:Diacylglycerol kinase (ATP) n=1 Tax=Daejeonella lutea TaxID=572036 RepID=A0A1T5CYU4_9SPHI|nr:diacylglycerol kinase family protein [Daejeonella lutea]SKB64521.1 diacylglycerol kinase (ATP) [Daejeonella lutea]
MSKFIKGFYFAWQGIAYSFRTQLNFKVEVFSALCVIAVSYYLGLSTAEWLWIALAITLVLVSELANTAIETLVDLVSPDYNPKAGIVKDISAAVVLLTGLFALVTGILILLPKILHAL